jgi:type II secretory pathway pseudopilin PulG
MTQSSMTPQRSIRSGGGERGYILLTLLLIISLMIIFAAVIVPTITFEIRRDKEEELIHRGVQYSRAIRAYYKKYGAYPTTLEQLESTNNLRFLRKRYKDPITGKDFKLLHYGEVQMSFGGGAIPGATPVSAMASGAGANGSAFGQSPSGQVSSGQSTFGGNSAFGQSSGLGGNSAFGQSSSFGNNTNSAFGQNQQNQQANNQTAGTDASQAQGNSDQSGAATPTVYGANGGSDQEPAGQQVQAFGGVGVVGVASISKKDTIREFNHKHKYNEWQFIYDPGTDRGGLLMTPNQPALMPQAAPLNGQTGTNGTNGINGTGTSFGNGIGSQPNGGQNGFQNSPQNPPSQPVAPAVPNDPNNPPQQQ